MEKISNNSCILIDGNYCLYQSYYSLLNLKTNTGFPTNTIYGFINIINKLIKKIKPKTIIIIFDTPTKNFRHKLYKNYKKNRKPMPENLQIQIQPLQKILFFMGIPVLSIKNVEADDIIGTISVKLIKKYKKILIYSADKDFIQLINENVHIIPGDIKIFLTDKEIYQKYGIFPNSMADFLSLVGDKSDNIPGVKGIGEKTAAYLLKKFNSLEEIYNNLDILHQISIKGITRIIQLLIKNKNNAFLSLKLTKINTKIDIPQKYLCYILKKPNILYLKKIFKIYQLNKYILEIHQKKFPIINLYKKNNSYI